MKAAPMSSVSRSYKPAKNVVWEEVAGEIIIFKLENGEYFRLNNTGMIVWRGIVSGYREDRIIDQLKHEFSGSPAQIARDFEAFINNLMNEGLVEIED